MTRKTRNELTRLRAEVNALKAQQSYGTMTGRTTRGVFRRATPGKSTSPARDTIPRWG